MDLQNFDLHRLTILWQASLMNLELRQLIEAELQRRIAKNNFYSREYLFQVCKLENHAITISFIPTTESFNTYGTHVTIDVILDDSEMEEMLKNYSTKPPIYTSGQVRAKTLVTEKLSQEKIDRLTSFGFHTKEILVAF